LTTDGGGGSAGACNMPSVAGAGAAAAKPVAAAALRLLLLLPPLLQAVSSCRSVRECSAWLRSQINCPASSRECVASSQTTTTATHHAVSRPALAHFSFVSIAISFTPFLPPLYFTHSSCYLAHWLPTDYVPTENEIVIL